MRIAILELRQPNNVSCEGGARLFEPRLLEWHGRLMLFRGFESATGRETRWAVVQEWRLEVR